MLELREWLIGCLKKIKDLIIKYKIVVVLCFVLFANLIVALPKAFAQPQSVRSVEIFSEKADYNNKEAGAWKVTKSAKWIGKNEAEITFDVDTVMKEIEIDKDVLLVLDTSASMSKEKLNKVKSDSTELIESLLSNNKNRVGLITFNTSSDIVSELTNDKDELVGKVQSLTADGNTNYYQALVNVDNILKNYNNKIDRKCIILFLTDGYPCEETPNEVGQYEYLKSQYPYVTINSIQYDMGNNLLDSLKSISDNQYIADVNALNNVLYETSMVLDNYEYFEITDYINSDNFYIEAKKDINIDQGEIDFDGDTQSIRWLIKEFKTSRSASMKIKVKLKNESNNLDLYYSTNIKETVKSKLGDIEEDVMSSNTPILAAGYSVIYDSNAPIDCNVEGIIPVDRKYSPFHTVEISDTKLKCDGYQFKGWEIANENRLKINDDYFTMPENNVEIRALWSKTSINKLMQGEVYTRVPATIEKYVNNYSVGLHKYKSSITEIVFQNSLNNIEGAIDVLDISVEKNGEILAYIVPNQNNSTMYTAYVQGDGKIVANSDSRNLFYNFVNLKSIKNLEYLDTSKVTDMGNMFDGCSNLTSLDLSSFDTANVGSTSSMFKDCSKLSYLNMNNFNTSKVNYMFDMFYLCESLTNLDLSSFNTSKVTNMLRMFFGCSSLRSINVSSFDTSSVSDMSAMFGNCKSLVGLDISNFDTSNVKEMGSMFYYCSSLTSLDLSSFNTSKVTDMKSMFWGCTNLTTTITIANTLTYSSNLFLNAATAQGSLITVNYTSKVAGKIDTYIKSKSSNSNVVKGKLIVV